MANMNFKVTEKSVKADMTQEEINKLQETIDHLMAFYHEDGIVLVIDEARRLVHPLRANWLEEKSAFALAHLHVYDPREDAADWLQGNVLKTIGDAIDICGF